MAMLIVDHINNINKSSHLGMLELHGYLLHLALMDLAKCHLGLIISGRLKVKLPVCVYMIVQFVCFLLKQCEPLSNTIEHTLDPN